MYRQIYDAIDFNENVHINHLRSIWSLAVFANHQLHEFQEHFYYYQLK